MIGFGAIWAGQGLVLDPTGSALTFRTEWLEGSPFHDYTVPGLFLLLVIAPSNLLSGLAQLRETEVAGIASLLSGLVLLVWIGVQWTVIGYQHWSQIGWTAAFLLLTWLAAAGLGAHFKIDRGPASGPRPAR